MIGGDGWPTGGQATAAQDRAKGDGAMDEAEAVEQTASATGEVVLLGIEELVPAEDNPRREVCDVSELATSIKAAGILQPLIVMPRDDGRYLIVVGHRRHAAARQAGLAEVPAIVRAFSESGRLEAMAIENLARADLSSLEEAGAFRALIERCGYSQRRLAATIGCSQAHVSRRLALLDLPAEATEALDTGRITIEDALELTKLKRTPERLAAALQDGTTRGAWDIRRAVEAHLQEEKRAEAFAGVVAAAEAGAVPYVAMVETNWGGWTLPRGAAYLERSWQGLDIKEADHAAEPCHAVTVDPHHPGAGLRAICTDIHRHEREAREGGLLPGVAGRSEDDKERARRKRQHNKVRREAEAARISHMEQLLKGRVRQGDVVERLVGALVDERSNDRAARIACGLLGIEVPKGTHGYPDAKKGLADFAAQGPECVARAGLALAFGIAEEPLRSDYPSFTQAKGHFAFLERCGYAVSEAERLEVSGKAPR